MSGFTEPAKKHLGQNFLHERSVIDKIVQAVNPQPGDAIVEIGPGQGALTFPLLQKHGELTAIEFDRDLHAPLQAAAREHGTLRLIEGDVLGVDFTALAEAGTNAGFELAGYSNQANFLLGNGITDLLLQAEQRTDEVGQLRLRDQLKRLTLPTEMGERFQVMGFSRDVDMSAAFLLGDLTWRL